MKTKQAKHKWLELSAALAAALAMTAVLILILKNPDGITDWLLTHMPQAVALQVLIVLVLYFLQGLVPFFMYNIVVLISGLLFPFPMAMAINCVGTIACMIGPYWAGKYLRVPWLERKLAENRLLNRFAKGHNGSQFLLSYLLRAIGMSNTILGLFFGSLDMRFRDFLISGLLGILPNMICFSILGSTKSLKSPALWVTVGIYVLIFLLALAYFKKKGSAQHEAPAAS